LTRHGPQGLPEKLNEPTPPSNPPATGWASLHRLATDSKLDWCCLIPRERRGAANAPTEGPRQMKTLILLI